MAEFRFATLTERPPLPLARKSMAGENFPVASVLLPRHVRPHVLAFYRFVRLADDIADDPYLDSEVKLAHLDALERALTDGTTRYPDLRPALELHDSLRSTGLPDRYPRQMLRAFRRDASGARCRTWSDLMLYCRFSAAPVGRFLLDIHGDPPPETGPLSDALCAALQVLNHLQDCRADWIDLGRCYLPTVWFDEAGISLERLVERDSDPRLRAVFDRTLDQVDRLLQRAAPLAGTIRHRGLRLETAVIHSLAEALAGRLRLLDPLAQRVTLAPPSRMLAAVRGLARGFSATP